MLWLSLVVGLKEILRGDQLLAEDELCPNQDTPARGAGAIPTQEKRKPMIRNLKALGRVIVAVLVMSAVVASSASAATFHSSETKTILTGNNTNHGAAVMKVGEAFTSCTTMTLTGTMTGDNGTTTATTISLRPTFSGCNFLGETAAIDTTGCTFKIQSHTSGQHLPTYIDCTSPSEITKTSGACTLHFPSQLTTGGTTATNLGSGATADITLHMTMTATFTKTGPLCFLISGNTGTFTATATLQGFKEGSISKNLHEDGYVVTEGPQVGISWS